MVTEARVERGPLFLVTEKGLEASKGNVKIGNGQVSDFNIGQTQFGLRIRDTDFDKVTGAVVMIGHPVGAEVNILGKVSDVLRKTDHTTFNLGKGDLVNIGLEHEGESSGVEIKNTI